MWENPKKKWESNHKKKTDEIHTSQKNIHHIYWISEENDDGESLSWRSSWPWMFPQTSGRGWTHHSPRIHGIGIFSDPWMVEFYGKCRYKYTRQPWILSKIIMFLKNHNDSIMMWRFRVVFHEFRNTYFWGLHLSLSSRMLFTGVSTSTFSADSCWDWCEKSSFVEVPDVEVAFTIGILQLFWFSLLRGIEIQKFLKGFKYLTIYQRL